MATPNSPKAKQYAGKGPARGRIKGESIEDQATYVTNPKAKGAYGRDCKKMDEHPMSHRLKRRQVRHLQHRFGALGPEFNKVMASKHPGKHRVGKVRSM